MKSDTVFKLMIFNPGVKFIHKSFEYGEYIYIDPATRETYDNKKGIITGTLEIVLEKFSDDWEFYYDLSLSTIFEKDISAYSLGIPKNLYSDKEVKDSLIKSLSIIFGSLENTDSYEFVNEYISRHNIEIISNHIAPINPNNRTKLKGIIVDYRIIWFDNIDKTIYIPTVLFNSDIDYKALATKLKKVVNIREEYAPDRIELEPCSAKNNIKQLLVRRNVFDDLETFIEVVTEKASKYKNIINISYLSEREAVIIYKEKSKGELLKSE